MKEEIIRLARHRRMRAESLAFVEACEALLESLASTQTEGEQ